MEWAFRTFKPYALYKKDDVITKADIWLGDAPSVSLIIPEDLKLTLSRTARDKMKVTVKMNNPVAAPVKKGQRLATLIVSAPRSPVMSSALAVPVILSEEVVPVIDAIESPH